MVNERGEREQKERRMREEKMIDGGQLTSEQGGPGPQTQSLVWEKGFFPLSNKRVLSLTVSKRL